MRKLIILILLATNTFSHAQEITSLKWGVVQPFNTRSAKTDTVFDWYIKSKIDIEVDSTYKLYLMYNREREVGTLYWSYQVRFDHEYFTANREFDTERDTLVDLTSFSARYPIIKKYLKVGYDFSVDHGQEFHSAYIATMYKDFFYAEIAFLEDIRRIYVKFDPTLLKKERLELKVDINALQIKREVKWNAGFQLRITII